MMTSVGCPVCKTIHKESFPSQTEASVVGEAHEGAAGVGHDAIYVTTDELDRMVFDITNQASPQGWVFGILTVG